MNYSIFLIALLFLAQVYPKHVCAGWFGSTTNTTKASEDVEEPLNKAKKLKKSGDVKNSIPFFQQASDKGNAEAMGQLGGIYSFGNGVEVDEKKGRSYLQKAAEKGDAYAQTNLGIILHNDGKYSEGIDWLQKAADQNFPHALTVLGGIFYNTNSPDGKKVGLSYLHKAADQGEIEAMQELAGIYKKTKDGVEAKKWKDKIAETEKNVKQAANLEKKNKRDSLYVCKCRATLEYVQNQIDRENEVGRVSGFVDKVKLRNLGLNLVSIREYIGSTEGRVPASDCGAKPTPSTFESCMEKVAEHYQQQYSQ